MIVALLDDAGHFGKYLFNKVKYDFIREVDTYLRIASFTVTVLLNTFHPKKLKSQLFELNS